MAGCFIAKRFFVAPEVYDAALFVGRGRPVRLGSGAGIGGLAELFDMKFTKNSEISWKK